MALAAAAAGGVALAAYLDGKFQLGRDAKALWSLKAAERAHTKRVQQDRLSPWYYLESIAREQPDVRCIWERHRTWTYREVHEHSLQWAAWMLERGVRPGDLVSMYLHNSAEFLIIFFATLAIGASAALINYNLEGAALLHCLKVAHSKLLIVDADAACQRRIEGSRKEIEGAGMEIFTLDDEMEKKTRARPVEEVDDGLRRGVQGEFPYALIYTSGTTGMPKGAPFTTERISLHLGSQEPKLGGIRGQDCWYNPMPMYHGTGLIMTTTSLLTGMGVAIAPRFSVSHFWSDIYHSGSTAFIYVGETARYLLAGPPDPLERAHKVRVVYGNGLRPDVWQKFQRRFNIPEICEFFNSSEGGFGLAVWSRNEYTSACVGHHGGLLRTILNKTYVPTRIDLDTGDLWRDPKTGFAQRMSYDEGGEILVEASAGSEFKGYWKNSEATNKRFLTDVFQKGDVYFRSGDALRRGKDGHWYFLDRLSDGFRWKSENVSTAEVAETLGKYPGIAEANVYGVEVPGHEGRAGCAAIDAPDAERMDYADLVRYARSQLPGYAVPVFLRIVKRSSHIHNHKQNKVGLRKEGVDPDKRGMEEKEGGDDAVLWWRPGTEKYVPFEREDWQKLVDRQVRL